MSTLNLGELRRQVPLRIPVLNGALPLAAAKKRVAQGQARSHRCALGVGNKGIIACWPAFLGHVKAVVSRLALVVEPAKTRVEAGRKGRSESIGPTHGNASALDRFRTAVLAKPSLEWVPGQAGLLKISEPPKKVLFVGDVLIRTPDVLVDIATSARRLREIVKKAWPCRV